MDENPYYDVINSAFEKGRLIERVRTLTIIDAILNTAHMKQLDTSTSRLSAPVILKKFLVPRLVELTLSNNELDEYEPNIQELIKELDTKLGFSSNEQ